MTFTVDNRIEVARANTMRAARLADERGDRTTHHRLLLAADALDDAAESASSYDFKRHLVSKSQDEDIARQKAAEARREVLALVDDREQDPAKYGDER
jgi:hypothetical protein